MKRGLLVRLATVVVVLVTIVALSVISKVLPIAAGPNHVEAAMGSWHFTYTVPGTDATGDYSIGVDYPRDSAAEVRAAAAAMNQQARQFAQAKTPFQATIVFIRPLSIAEFDQFIADAGLAPTGSIVRAIQPGGIRVTMGVPPVWATDGSGHRVPGQVAAGQPPFDSAAFDRLQQSHSENHVLGVISTDVTLDAAAYARVQNAPQVFALDTLQVVVVHEVQRAHPGTPAAKIHVQASRLYWAMEDTGVAPTK